MLHRHTCAIEHQLWGKTCAEQSSVVLFCRGDAYWPVLLVACGSFNPPTIMHLRMFELAADALRGVRSPSSLPPLFSLNRNIMQHKLR